ncbi:MAG TPA: S-layer homology domain-containing protein [Symbiobacteriaceae bacterium]|nr:S-layer homology domain-containing protein [Symbiobacteriaceae bacterium]
MNIRRVAASVALSALLLGTTAMPAMAEKGGNGSDKGHGNKVSDKFKDMGDFEWGLGDVTKMMLKGIFNGRGEGIFAPGAKINHQESAVAIVRLMDKEAAAKALSAAEVDSLLGGISDADQIAAWAKPSVAMLVKVGVLSEDAPFKPLDDATRLDIAVLLVNAMGLQSEAEEKMDEKLSFKDAHLIPAELTGYVKVAVDHQLITGYDDKTFRPMQAVKRVEMAVMMGRADRLIEKEKHDEIKGVIKSVDAAEESLVVTAGDKEIALTLAEEASIFIDGREKDLPRLAAGMRVEIKLNGDGEVVYIEAKSVAAPQDPAVTGAITHLVPATPTALGLISIGGTAYPISPKAVIKLNGQTATFADLEVGDTVKAATTYGLVIKLEATREAETETVEGTITAIKAATQSALAKVTLSVDAGDETTRTEYVVAANAAIKINGESARMAGLRLTDEAKLTLENNLVTRIEVKREATTVSGTISDLDAATSSAPAKITVTFPSLTTPAVTAEYSLASGAVIKINGRTAQFADLRVDENVKLTLGAGLVDKVEVTREYEVLEGSVISLAAPTAGQDVPAGTVGLVGLVYTSDGSATMNTFPITGATQILVNGQTAQFAGLRLGDTAKAYFDGDVLVKLQVTR